METVRIPSEFKFEIEELTTAVRKLAWMLADREIHEADDFRKIARDCERILIQLGKL